MIKQLLFFSLLFLSITSYGQEKINWMTWEEALKANEKEPRKFFVDVYTDWCGWCKRMDATTFTHPVVTKLLKDKFYAVKFDAESDKPIVFKGKNYVNPNPDLTKSTHELAVALLNGSLGYPTVVLLDEGLNSFGPMPGYKKPEDLEPVLKYVGSEAYKTQKWQDYQTNFKSEIK